MKAADILCVVVVYNRNPEDVRSWNLLQLSLAAGTLRHLLVYDNSPVPVDAHMLPPSQISYFHDPTNGGTAGAYAYAASIAHDVGCGWLLLLDQDTYLPAHYVDLIRGAAAKSLAEVAALLPRVEQAGTLISPARVDLFGTVKPLKEMQFKNYHITAISSGVVLQLGAFRKILPIHAALWLDYVDHWIFLRLKEEGYALALLDVCIQHDLSIRSPATLSFSRLESILSGEVVYYSQLGIVPRIVYPFRLLKRTLLYCLIRPVLALRTLNWIFTRSVRQ